MLSVLAKPRAMIRRGDYYGPEPRNLATYRPDAEGYADVARDKLPRGQLVLVN
jgi:hypothetical protein